MRWRYQIYVVCPQAGQLLINSFEPLNGNYFAFHLAADIVILAKNTIQIAAGKKDCSGTPAAADDRFLPMVQTGSCHHDFSRSVTDSRENFTRRKNAPFNVAFAGANVAI